MMSMEGNVYVCTSYHTAGNKRHSISKNLKSLNNTRNAIKIVFVLVLQIDFKIIQEA